VPIKPESPAPGTKPTQTSAIRSEASQKRPTPPPQKPGSSYPAIRSSTLDLDAKPIHDASGKPVTELDMDADFGEDDKPWRRPGSDQTDYFNYGFDEFTWASYCLKQDSLRKEAKDQKKQLEDMQNFMGMGGGAAPNAAPTMPGMPGMSVGGDMPPEMQQMMQQMMSQGMDPTQMDFNQFVQMMGPGAGQQGMQQGYGQQGGQQQMGGYGYGGGGGHSGHGGHGGRGGRGRGRW
jgi:pre-mRNA 3'-end-processing factor FIP1